MNINDKVRRQAILIGIFIIASLQLCMRAASDIRNSESLGDKIYSAALSHGIALYHPYSLYIGGIWEKRNLTDKILYQFYKDMPLEMCMIKENDSGSYFTEYMQHPESDAAKITNNDSMPAVDIQDNDEVSEMAGESVYQELEQAVLAENTAASGTFIPVQAPVAQYSRQQLSDPGFVRETFYAVDATTQVREEQLQYNTLMGFDASLKQDNSKVQILVYHTHSQEKYIDSTEGDSSTSIVGVGEHLCDILRTQYGFNVLHHTGEYDVESRDYAY